MQGPDIPLYSSDHTCLLNAWPAYCAVIFYYGISYCIGSCQCEPHIHRYFGYVRSLAGLSRVTFHILSYSCQSIEYLRAVAGCRTVPVEVGSRYTDEAWSQTLITVNEFIDRYIVGEVCTVC